MSEAVLELDGVVRTFHQAGRPLEVLRGASMRLQAGELVALLGPSGSGKSTLLHIVGLLERPDAGEVLIAGAAAGRMSDRERTHHRCQHLGFVYQFRNLLTDFTALENVMLPQMIAGQDRSAARCRAEELLRAVGLSQRLNHQPARLSGGEQQRVAMARALANSPRILLADEPTGNLDPHTAEGVFDQLAYVVRERGLTALVATHNMELARRMDRALSLEAGWLSPLEL